MADHHVTCPHCGAPLLVTVSPTMGGSVEENLVLYVDPEALVSPAAVVPDVPQATPAAVAHAEATGVDLTQVEGSGKPVEVPVVTTETVPTITKADVALAAAEQVPADTEPVNPTPVDAPAPDAPVEEVPPSG